MEVRINGYKNKNTVMIVLSKSDILNNKIQFIHNDEFSLNGNMYDIICKYETKDSVHFTCYNDEKEEKLIVNYVKTSKNSGDYGLINNINIKLYQLNYSSIYTSPGILTNIYLEDNSKCNNHFKLSNYSSLFLDVSVPPPKFRV
jgi:hypothetical protein